MATAVCAFRETRSCRSSWEAQTSGQRIVKRLIVWSDASSRLIAGVKKMFGRFGPLDSWVEPYGDVEDRLRFRTKLGTLNDTIHLGSISRQALTGVKAELGDEFHCVYCRRDIGRDFAPRFWERQKPYRRAKMDVG